MSISPERSQFVFQKLERNLLRLLAGHQAESVHSFRTSTRRLETLLEELLPERDRNQKKLLKILGRIRKRAGKVRDLDVQLAALRSLKTPQEPRRKTLLMQGLIELRVKHEKRLHKTLTKDGIRDLRRRLKRASKDAKPEAGRDPLLVARQMLSEVERPAGVLTEEVLHRYRIVVKRARYAAEFANETAEGRRFIAQLKRLQDAIGHWHDWLTLTHTATKRLGDVNQSSLVAALHNVTGGKFRHAVAELSATSVVQAGPNAIPLPQQAARKPGKSPTVETRTDSAA